MYQKGYVVDFSFVSQDSSSILRDQDIKNGLNFLIRWSWKIEGIKTARVLYTFTHQLQL